MQRTEQGYDRDTLDARSGKMPMDRLVYGGQCRKGDILGNWTGAAARALYDDARYSTQEKSYIGRDKNYVSLGASYARRRGARTMDSLAGNTVNISGFAAAGY